MWSALETLLVFSSLLPIPLTFFSTQNIRVCAPDGDALPQLNICLGHCHVKSWVLSSREAATMVAESLPVSYLSSEVGGVNVRGGALTPKCDDTCMSL